MHHRDGISDLALEQYLLEELSPGARARVQAALQADERLKARLEALRDSDRQILARYPSADMAAAIRSRAQAPRFPRAARGRGRRTGSSPAQGGTGRRFPPFALALPLAAAAALFISVFAARERLVPQVVGASVAEVTRLKGAKTRLSIYRKAGDGAEELAAGQAARERDTLQISYTAAEAKYGLIVSVDGRGTVTWHLPAAYAGSSVPAPALGRQGEVVLPSAYELDDAPGFERFILVYSQKPFDASLAEKAVRALAAQPRGAQTAALVLPAGLGQYSFVVRKQGALQ
jgi:hypothetical protein